MPMCSTSEHSSDLGKCWHEGQTSVTLTSHVRGKHKIERVICGYDAWQ